MTQDFKTQLFLFVLLLFAFSLNAQNEKIGLLCNDKGEFLPYGTIQISQNSGTTTNENGIFRLLSKIEKNQSICFSYVGFESKCIKYSEIKDTVFLQTSNVLIDDITVVGKKKDWYKYVFECNKKLKKRSSKKLIGKCYTKKKTFKENELAEESDVFYNVELKKNEPFIFSLKQGVSNIYIDNHEPFLNCNLLLTAFSIFEKNPKHLSLSPFGLGFKKFKKNFRIKYLKTELYDGIEHRLFLLEPLLKENKFSVSVLINKENNTFRKIEIFSNAPNEKDFKDQDLNPVAVNLKMIYTFNFKRKNYFLESIHAEETYNVADANFKNTNHYFFYDYGKPFLDDITEVAFSGNDYEDITRIPFSKKFWNQQSFYSTSILRNKTSERFVLPNQLTNYSQIPSIPKNNNGEVIPIIIPPGKDTTIVETLFLYTFFHIQVYSEKNKVTYQVYPMIDLKRSFLLEYTPETFEYGKREVEKSVAIAKALENELNETLSTNYNQRKIENLNRKFQTMLEKTAFSKASGYWKIDWNR